MLWPKCHKINLETSHESHENLKQTNENHLQTHVALFTKSLWSSHFSHFTLPQQTMDFSGLSTPSGLKWHWHFVNPILNYTFYLLPEIFYFKGVSGITHSTILSLLIRFLVLSFNSTIGQLLSCCQLFILNFDAFGQHGKQKALEPAFCAQMSRLESLTRHTIQTIHTLHHHPHHPHHNHQLSWITILILILMIMTVESYLRSKISLRCLPCHHLHDSDSGIRCTSDCWYLRKTAQPFKLPQSVPNYIEYTTCVILFDWDLPSTIFNLYIPFWFHKNNGCLQPEWLGKPAWYVLAADRYIHLSLRWVHHLPAPCRQLAGIRITLVTWFLLQTLANFIHLYVYIPYIPLYTYLTISLSNHLFNIFNPSFEASLALGCPIGFWLLKASPARRVIKRRLSSCDPFVTSALWHFQIHGGQKGAVFDTSWTPTPPKKKQTKQT